MRDRRPRIAQELHAGYRRYLGRDTTSARFPYRCAGDDLRPCCRHQSGRAVQGGGQAPGPHAMINSGSVQDGVAQVAEPGETALKLEDFLPHKLNVLSSLVSQALTRVYGQRYGIGIPEWRVLVTLGQYGVMTGKAIGAHTHMHKTKVSRAVAQLEQRKFVARRANRADLREAFLSLTPSGRAIYDEAAPIALDFTNRLSEVVAPSDRAAFDRAMRLLTERSAELVVEIEARKT
jgi:DNA-binding MarR family transcriptional regulator